MTYPYCSQVYRVGDYGFNATDEYTLMKELEEYYSSKGAKPAITPVADGVLLTIDGYLGDAFEAAHAKIRELRECAKDDYASRKVILKEALEINPLEQVAYRFLALVYLGEGNSEEAFRNATEALKLSPTNKWDLLVMGRLMFEIRKDREAAEKYFERALQFHPGDENVLRFIDRVFAGEME